MAVTLQFLKSNKLERNRKTGFKCPRGCGKGTTFKEACPGKIDKSHPIHPRSEESKKKKKVRRGKASSVAGAFWHAGAPPAALAKQPGAILAGGCLQV